MAMITVLDYLESNERKFPAHTICEDEVGKLPLSDFVNKAKSIGTYLCQYQMERQPIAVFMDNTAASWVAMMGVVYSGNFYVLIDAMMPIERIKGIIQTLDLKVLIVDEKCSKQAQRLEDVEVLLYDTLVHTQQNDAVLQAVRKKLIDTDPVYALFTSGSTGVPKGTVVNHASVIKYTQWYIETFHINENTIFGSQTPFYFSMSVATLFSGIMAAACLVLIPKQMFSFPVKLIEFMNEKKINTIYWVPSAMKIIANYKVLDNRQLPYLKTVLFCGEVMPTKQLNYWRAHMPEDTLFANLYGPTETTDVATYYVVDRPFRDDESLPIGNACANCAVMIVKEDGTLAQDGEEGELLIRGSFLASGYYNNPQKTSEVFCQNPLNTAYPELVYRTGDIVKYNEYGEILYLTRKDFQIKHQGYRIEPGEIETAISAVAGVFECASIYDEKDSLIVLYCTGTDLSAKKLIEGVRDRLPKYMIPNKFIILDEMPHNANGKIDKKELKRRYEQGRK